MGVAQSVMPSTSSLKRPFGETESAEESDSVSSPKRQKMLSKTKYIYRTLFEKGHNSDVKIVALNRTWNLHRRYLSKSPYFYCMFNGHWIETMKKEINIAIEDENITIEALHEVFGSLYQDEIQVMPLEVVSILASATFFQLDDLIAKTIEVMKENLNIDTVLQYYEIAGFYGVEELKNVTLNWLCTNTFLHLATSPTHLRQTSCDLMTKLISSPELVVIEREFSLYLLLKHWVFLKENCSPMLETLSAEADQYFKTNRSLTPFLLKDIGIPYQEIFRALRFKHLLTHPGDRELIESDNIIPADWLTPKSEMHKLKKIGIVKKVRPRPSEEVRNEYFNRDCMRFGRVLQPHIQKHWGWKLLNFGFDKEVFYECRVIIRISYRNKTDSTGNKYNASQPKKRHLMFRIRLYSCDKSGRVLTKDDTGIQKVALNEREKNTVLEVSFKGRFPALVSVNDLLTFPGLLTAEFLPISIQQSTHDNRPSSR